jgi:CRISPR-associated protein Cas2
VKLFILIIYDISDNETRFKLANYLKSKGFSRIQRSAFVGKPIPATLRDVERSLPKYISSGEDVIHLIPLLEYSVQHFRVYGKPLAEITTERKLLVIE